MSESEVETVSFAADAVQSVWFAAGLTKIAIACRQEADENTLRVYAWAMAKRVTPHEWRDFADDSIRTGRYQWLPALQVLQADYDAWRAQREAPKRDAAVRSENSVWASPEQRDAVEAVVRSTPRGATEGPFAYVRRIAIVSGLMLPEKGDKAAPMPHVTRDRGVRLPYREAGEDDGE